jgi:hypothetical protein
MTLLGANGQPILSDKSLTAEQQRAKDNYEALLAVVNERQMPPAELADQIGTLFNLWCEHCPAGLFEQNGNAMMNFFLGTLQKHAPLKAGELKIRASLQAANSGTILKQ